MKNFIFFLFLLFVPSAWGQSSSQKELHRSIDSLFNSVEGNFAIAFKDLSAPGDSIFINEHKSFHAASTMKTPVMIEIYKQAEEGKFKLSDSLLVKNEFRSIVDGSSFRLEMARDSGEKLYAALGRKRPIQALVRDMIIHSSNLATNILVELVDAGNVNQSMRQLGAKDINVLRGVEDIKAYDAGLSNNTTAYDLLLILEHLAKGTAVNPEADKEMVEILLDQAHRDIIPAKLPESVKVANKTGSIDGLRHDSAIVFLPDGRKYILVLLSEEMPEVQEGVEMLSAVSRLVYEHMLQKD